MFLRTLRYRAESAGRPVRAGSHDRLLPARQSAVAGTQGGHAQGTLLDDRRQETFDVHRGSLSQSAR